MKIKKIILAWLIFAFLPECNNPVEINHVQSEIIDIPEESNGHLLNDSLTTNFRIIPLETKENCLISEIRRLIIAHDKFYIQDDRTRSILIFNQEGKFLYKIDKLGKGPGEYTQLLDFNVDKKGNIFILEWLRIIKYDPNGKYLETLDYNHLKTKENGFYPFNIAILDNEDMYFYTGTMGGSGISNLDHYAVTRVNNKAEIVSKNILMERVSQNYPVMFYKNSSNEYFMQTLKGNDTIYSLSTEGVIPKYFVNFGKKSFPPDYFPKQFKDMGKIYFDADNKTEYRSIIHNITESNNLLYFNFRGANKIFEALYSKKSKKTKVGRVFTHPTAAGIQNYNPQTDEFISIMADMSIALIQDERKKYKDEYSKTDKKIIEYIDSTQEKFNNPFLVAYKLKDF